MIQFDELTIDYVDNMTLLAKAEAERTINNFIERFSYTCWNKTLNIPKKPKAKYFRWIVQSINHEFLHHILNELENSEASKSLDAFAYEDIVCGGIEKEHSETL